MSNENNNKIRSYSTRISYALSLLENNSYAKPTRQEWLVEEQLYIIGSLRNEAARCPRSKNTLRELISAAVINTANETTKRQRENMSANPTLQTLFLYGINT